MWRSWRRSWGVGCLVWLGAGSAAAQEGAETPGAAAPPAATPVAGPADAAPPAVVECVPRCRSGFMCHAGQCVSRCNPPCRRSERCLANGECEAEEYEEEEDDEGDERRAIPEAKNSVLRPAGSWVFGARGGLQVIGGGHVERSCSSTGALSCNGSSEADFDERSYVMLGLDALIHVAPGLRLGLGYELVPYSALKGKSDDDDEAAHLGHEHALGAIVEGLLPVGPRLALALRAQGGIRMLALGATWRTTAIVSWSSVTTPWPVIARSTRRRFSAAPSVRCSASSGGPCCAGASICRFSTW